MQSYELSCPHTHNDSTDRYNQIKYSQHRLSLHQQPFNCSPTILLRLFWTMKAHFHPAQGCVFSPLTLLAQGPPEPTGYGSDGWQRQRTTHFPFLVLPSVALAPSWDPHGVSLMQVCTVGLPDCSRAGQEQLQGWCLLPLQVFLPSSNKETEAGVGDTHTSKM